MVPSEVSRSQRRFLVPPREDYSGDPQALAWPLITDYVYLLANGGQPLDLDAQEPVLEQAALQVIVKLLFDELR
jgi:hypothetical protein